MFDEDLEQVRRSLEAIRTTSTKSLTSLRGMLDMVHPADQSPVSLGVGNPSFEGSDRIGLSGLIDLVEQVRAGGLPVRLEMTGLQCSPAPDADAAAYRVVQEALTNVLRHAGATVAEVTVAQQEHEFVVRVRDRGHCGPGPATEGRGLSGMRRRVLAAGGSFQAGPRDGGSFHVEARLPMRAAVR